MAEKGKKGKGAGAKSEAQKDKKPVEPPPPKIKSEQPKSEVGTRKGFRRYKWEFIDSNKEFWLMGHGEVKTLSFVCLITALVLFTETNVHPLLALLVTMELSIFSFFIIVHTFAVQRYMPFVLWPITDILNDLFATIFLVGAVVFAVKARQTMPVNYVVAVVFISLAAFFPLIDICLQRKHFRGKKIRKNVLIPPEKKDKEKPEETAKPKEEKPAEKTKEEGKPAEKPKEGKPAEKPKEEGKAKGKKKK